MALPDTRYWVGFSRVSGVGAVRMRRLLDAFGDAERAWHAGSAELRAAGLDERTTAALLRTRGAVDLDAELLNLDRLGITPLTWPDRAFPRRLKEIYDPPLVLFVRGDLQLDDEWAIAVVGTRRTTAYGRQVAEQFAGSLARAGITIVSGLAVGIDTIAHRAALDAGGRTIAVQARGLDAVYPVENLALARELMQHGAMVSEHAPGVRPLKESFPMRNRIIAGLSLGVLIVEGDEKSGALITARQAVDQNREVFAIPGSIFNPASGGPNKLIRDGEAKLVRTPDEILEELNLRMALQLPDSPAPALPAGHKPTGPGAEVLAVLNWEPKHIDDIAREAGLSVPTVSSSLTILELSGMVRQVGALNYVKVRR